MGTHRRMVAAAAAATVVVAIAAVSGLVSGVAGASGTVAATARQVRADASAPGPQPSASAGPELVYVANVNGPVTAYPATAVGAVLPVRLLADPRDPNTFWGPWGVAFDAGRSAYVQSFLSNATTFVYAPGATLPNRIFRVDGPDSRAIAVDAAGYSYVASGQAGSVISVAAPGARGVPANLYSVAPVRQIPTDETPFHPWPSILTTDSAGHVIAAVVRSQGNAIEVFAGGPAGPASPMWTIAGPRTGLGSCSGVACEQIALTFSRLTGELYVAVSQGGQTRINVYPATATGDTAPTRVISGPATGLAGQVVTGIAASRIDGSIYVMAKPSQFNSSGTVLVFDRFASGNSAPRRRVTDAATGFRDAQGIAAS